LFRSFVEHINSVHLLIAHHPARARREDGLKALVFEQGRKMRAKKPRGTGYPDFLTHFEATSLRTFSIGSAKRKSFCIVRRWATLFVLICPLTKSLGPGTQDSRIMRSNIAGLVFKTQSALAMVFPFATSSSLLVARTVHRSSPSEK